MTAAKQVEHFVWEPSGKATIDGYDLAELAKKYPTPFYLISQGQLRDNYRRLRQELQHLQRNLAPVRPVVGLAWHPR